MKVELDPWMLNELIEILWREKQVRIKSEKIYKITDKALAEKIIKARSENRWDSIGKVALIEELMLKARDGMNQDFLDAQTAVKKMQRIKSRKLDLFF